MNPFHSEHTRDIQIHTFIPFFFTWVKNRSVRNPSSNIKQNVNLFQLIAVFFDGCWISHIKNRCIDTFWKLFQGFCVNITKLITRISALISPHPCWNCKYLAYTVAPSLKKSSAVARPIPCPAAVITQTFPFKLISLIQILFYEKGGVTQNNICHIITTKINSITTQSQYQYSVLPVTNSNQLSVTRVSKSESPYPRVSHNSYRNSGVWVLLAVIASIVSKTWTLCVTTGQCVKVQNLIFILLVFLLAEMMIFRLSFWLWNVSATCDSEENLWTGDTSILFCI